MTFVDNVFVTFVDTLSVTLTISCARITTIIFFACAIPFTHTSACVIILFLIWNAILRERFSLFSSNAEKYGPEKFRVRTLQNTEYGQGVQVALVNLELQLH